MIPEQMKYVRGVQCTIDLNGEKAAITICLRQLDEHIFKTQVRIFTARMLHGRLLIGSANFGYHFLGF